MGLTPFVKKTQPDCPFELSFADCKDILYDTFELLDQNKRQLKLRVTADLPSFNYNQKNWRKSTLLTIISNFGLGQQEQGQSGQAVFDMEQIFKIHTLIKHFRKQKIEQRVTAKGEEEEQKQCCICLDQRATTMLPCGHSYCVLCTSKYIIEKEEHRCPQCRREFRGDKTSLNKVFYQVIEEDKMLYDEARSQILEHMAKYSVNTVRLLRQQAERVNKK